MSIRTSILRPRSTFTRRLRAVAGLAPAAWLGGCVIIPLPETPARFESEQLAFIEIGVTDRATVEARLGPPDYFWEDHRLMIYGWTTRAGWIIVAVPGAGNMEELRNGYRLLVQLDPVDRVRRHGIQKDEWFKSEQDEIAAWLAEPQGEELP
jgi:hypothetical protein